MKFLNGAHYPMILLNISNLYPSMYELALQDILDKFGDRYYRHFKNVMENRSRYIKYSLGCPYCYGNKNYTCCGQCLGKGEVQSLNFTTSGRFESVTRIEDSV